MEKNNIQYFCLRKDCKMERYKGKGRLVNTTTGSEFFFENNEQDTLLHLLTHRIEYVDDYVAEKIWSLDDVDVLRKKLVTLLTEVSPEYVITGSTREDVETNPLYDGTL